MIHSNPSRGNNGTPIRGCQTDHRSHSTRWPTRQMCRSSRISILDSVFSRPGQSTSPGKLSAFASISIAASGTPTTGRCDSMRAAARTLPSWFFLETCRAFVFKMSVRESLRSGSPLMTVKTPKLVSRVFMHGCAQVEQSGQDRSGSFQNRIPSYNRRALPGQYIPHS